MNSKNEKYINDFINYLRFVNNKSVNTLIAYKSDLTEFADFVAYSKKSLDEVGKADIEAFIVRQRQRGLSRRTTNRKLASIKKFYKFLTLNYIIPADPAKYVELSKLEKKVPVVLTPDNMKRLSEQMERLVRPSRQNKRNKTGEKLRLRNNAILNVFLNCGLRKSELIDLKLADLDLSEGTMLIHGKGAKQRIDYINNKTKRALEMYLSVRGQFKQAETSPYLFLSNGTSDKMAGSDVNRLVEKMFKRAGLDGNGFVVHTLRKTAATMMFRAGEDIRTIQSVLGHENIQTTTIYVGVAEEQKRAAMARELF